MARISCDTCGCLEVQNMTRSSTIGDRTSVENMKDSAQFIDQSLWVLRSKSWVLIQPQSRPSFSTTKHLQRSRWPCIIGECLGGFTFQRVGWIPMSIMSKFLIHRPCCKLMTVLLNAGNDRGCLKGRFDLQPRHPCLYRNRCLAGFWVLKRNTRVGKAGWRLWFLYLLYVLDKHLRMSCRSEKDNF